MRHKKKKFSGAFSICATKSKNLVAHLPNAPLKLF
jgi:hypothetical protein